MINCPLCQSSQISSTSHKVWPAESHNHCSVCDLIFLKKEFRLSNEKEKERYSHHKNDLKFPSYRKYLSQFIVDHDKFKNLKILDFGCGPHENLAILLNELNVAADSFDPFFGPALKSPTPKYDIIFAIEVFEHFHEPMMELIKLQKMLNSSGIVKIYTQLHQGTEHFYNWWYARDPTHVVFYSNKTANWIAENFLYETQLRELHSHNHCSPFLFLQVKAT